MTRIRNTSVSWGLAVGLWVFLLSTLVAQCGCTHASILDGHRAPLQRFEQAVRIEETCTNGVSLYRSYGSGVIVAPYVLLTAAHVATAQPGFACLWFASMIHGKRYMIVPDTAIREWDLASMRSVLEPFDPTYAVAYGPAPEFASHICAAPAFPQWLHRCGDVQTYSDPPGDMQNTIVTEPGNSGSGVYNDDGQLVGIVTHLWTCTGGTQICGGRAAILEGRLSAILRHQ